MALRIGGIVGAGFGGRGVADLANMIEAGIRNGYSRSLENQADRVGMEWMLASGYDIREAPRAWKAVSKRYGDHSTNLFWDAYSQLKKDSDDFHKVATAVKDAAQGKKKVKVKVAKEK
jgi:hypothetical protein